MTNGLYGLDHNTESFWRTILQNRAARNPWLSGHVWSRPLDPDGLLDPGRSFLLSFLLSPIENLANPNEWWACIVDGPLVSEQPTSPSWCRVEQRGERRGGIFEVFPVCQG
jgi:hypothetical protein